MQEALLGDEKEKKSLKVFISDFIRNVFAGGLQFLCESSDVLGPVDFGGADDGASRPRLVVVVVGLATEPEVVFLEICGLKQKFAVDKYELIYLP